jgi:hypothetical protein
MRTTTTDDDDDEVAYKGMEINTLKRPSHVGVTHVVEWSKVEREHSSLQIPI